MTKANPDPRILFLLLPNTLNVKGNVQDPRDHFHAGNQK